MGHLRIFQDSSLHKVDFLLHLMSATQRRLRNSSVFQHWSSSTAMQLLKVGMLFCSQHALAGPQKWSVVGGAYPRGARSSWPADRGSDAGCSKGGKVCRRAVITCELICAERVHPCLFIPPELRVSRGETWRRLFFRRSLIWPKESPFRPVSSWPERTILQPWTEKYPRHFCCSADDVTLTHLTFRYCSDS